MRLTVISMTIFPFARSRPCDSVTCHLPQANRDPDGAIDEAQVEQDAQVSET